MNKIIRFEFDEIVLNRKLIGLICLIWLELILLLFIWLGNYLVKLKFKFKIDFN